MQQFFWIIFDGTVDSSWVKSLNTALDNTRILSLVNGDMIPLPKNVKIVFETDSLHKVTAATLSRCVLLNTASGSVIQSKGITKFLDFFLARTSSYSDNNRLLLTKLEAWYARANLTAWIHKSTHDFLIGKVAMAEKSFPIVR